MEEVFETQLHRQSAGALQACVPFFELEIGFLGIGFAYDVSYIPFLSFFTFSEKQTRPFRVLGVTCTREFILLLIGLFSGAIFGVIAGIIRKNDERMINPCFMCHPQIQSGAAAEGEAGAPMGLGS